MAHRLRVKRFETEVKARAWARDFDHARQFHKLSLLEVEADETEGWWVVNPDVEAPMYSPAPPRTPLLR